MGGVVVRPVCLVFQNQDKRQALQPWVERQAEVREKTARQHEMDNEPIGDQEWAAHIRMLDREDPSYRN